MSAITQCAVLTPPGSAAVATIALIGPRAWTIVRSALRGNLPEIPDARRHWVGEFGTPPGDTVVVNIRRLDPTPWIEIHCHGGSQIVRWLMAELESCGAATVFWRDLVGELDLSPLRSAATIELTQAVTLRSAAILLDQFHGALDAELAAILALLSEKQVEQAHDRLAELLKYAHVGRHLTVPWRVVVAGKPNVGKSSLINRLVGYPRCVVTPFAGTTRDLVATAIAVDGWPVELIDTAGRRSTNDPLESAGVSLAEEVERSADLVLWLFDAESPTVSKSYLQVRNKIDIAPPINRGDDVIPISALTGEGLNELLAIMARRLTPIVPPPGAAVPFSIEIAVRLTKIAKQLSNDDVALAIMELRSLTA